MPSEKIKIEGEARECEGYILNIEEKSISFKTVGDLEEFISSYPRELVADSRWDYYLHEWLQGTWLEIDARPRLVNEVFKLNDFGEAFKGYYDPFEYEFEYMLNPYFEMSEALKIAEWCRKEYGDEVTYNKNTDAFTYDTHSRWSDHPMKYQGIDIDGMHLYPIGGKDYWSWIKP